MNSNTSHERLNDLLIAIHRSLAQYAAASWLWSAEGSTNLQETLRAVAERQERDVRRIAEFLMQKQHHVSFGVFPAAYTSLHYVSLSYLADRLVANQRSIIKAIEAALPDLNADIEARELGNRILQSQRECLELLKHPAAVAGAA